MRAAGSLRPDRRGPSIEEYRSRSPRCLLAMLVVFVPVLVAIERPDYLGIVDVMKGGDAALRVELKRVGAQKQADAIADAVDPAEWWRRTCPADPRPFNVTTEVERWTWWQGMLARFAQGWRPGSFQVEVRCHMHNLPAGRSPNLRMFTHPCESIADLAERAAARQGVSGDSACFSVQTGTQLCTPELTVGNYTAICRDSTLHLVVRGRGGGINADVPEGTRMWLKG
eukprot:gene32572-44374_t